MKVNTPSRVSIANTNLETPSLKTQTNGEGKTAIIVCHGMGQQVRFQPLSMITDILLTKSGLKASPENVKILRYENKSLPRVKLKLQKGEESKEIHLFEVYWAPLTEGRVTLRDVIKFLFNSGWEGIKYCLPGKFKRWAFGSLRSFEFPRFTTFLSLFVTVLVLLVSALFVIQLTLYISAKIISLYFDFFFTVYKLSLINSIVVYFGHLVNLVMAKPVSLLYFLFYAALIRLFYKLKYILIQYPGDVAAYISSHKLNKFYEVREQIKSKAMDAAKAVYFSVDQKHEFFLYNNIIVVGHSLGSVIAYDMLNGIINEDQTDNGTYQTAKRTKLFITFGSPLDKTAFLFRTHIKNESETREALAAAMQPLILSYDNRPFKWINVWSPMDIVSGKINYYDFPYDESNKNKVDNQIDWKAWIPFAAHNQYWRTDKVMDIIYNEIFK